MPQAVSVFHQLLSSDERQEDVRESYAGVACSDLDSGRSLATSGSFTVARCSKAERHTASTSSSMTTRECLRSSLECLS